MGILPTTAERRIAPSLYWAALKIVICKLSIMGILPTTAERRIATAITNKSHLQILQKILL